ncbi:hypothetical protein HAV15_000740 [Penicillium sp. str. |nr:hypothetical protein HAV15_000740 [Penicillium sp. str. \
MVVAASSIIGMPTTLNAILLHSTGTVMFGSIAMTVIVGLQANIASGWLSCELASVRDGHLGLACFLILAQIQDHLEG